MLFFYVIYISIYVYVLLDLIKGEGGGVFNLEYYKLDGEISYIFFKIFYLILFLILKYELMKLN